MMAYKLRLNETADKDKKKQVASEKPRTKEERVEDELNLQSYFTQLNKKYID